MKYGIYNTDGEYLHGDLRDYPDLAIDLDTSTASLYLKSIDSKIILGTSVNLHIGRSDTLLFIGEEDLNILNRETIRTFFKTAISEFEKLGYTIENIANDNELFEKIKSKPFRQFASEGTPPQPAQHAAAKLILNEPVYVVSRDTFNSISFIAEITELLKGSLSLSPGFIFVCSRKTFKAADLSILPGKPSTVEVEDVNLDTGRIVNTRDVEKYKNIFETFLSYGKKIIEKESSRTRFCQSIISGSLKKIPGYDEKKNWISFAKKYGVAVEFSTADIVNSTVQGDLSILNNYLPLNDIISKDLSQELNKLHEKELDLFLQNAASILKADREGSRILNSISYNKAVKAVDDVLAPQKNLLQLQKYLKSVIFYPDAFRKAISNLKKTDLDFFISISEKTLKSYRDAWAIIIEFRPPTAANAIQSMLRGSSLELEGYLKHNFNENEYYAELSKLSENNLLYFIDSAKPVISQYPTALAVANEVKKKRQQYQRIATAKKVVSLVSFEKLLISIIIVLIIVIAALILSWFKISLPIPNPFSPATLLENGQHTYPIADFFGTPTGGNLPLTVKFNDNSTCVSPTTWKWSFGDGNTSVLQNPVHMYAFNGTFTVGLTVTNISGNDTKTQKDYIIVTNTSGG